MRFDFVVPARTLFGWGRRAEVGPLAASLGRRAWLVTGSRTLERTGIVAELVERLSQAVVASREIASLSLEPEVADVDGATARLSAEGLSEGDFLLAIGGGSAIDLAKAVAAMATNADGGSVIDFLEGVGRGRKLTRPPLPVLAMPTTAGTGSEATKNAVISSYDPPFKKSLRHDGMLPAAVLIDPELTASLPPQVTAYTGMDAITQLIESYVSRRAQPIPRALAIEGLRLAVTALPEVVAEFVGIRDRENTRIPGSDQFGCAAVNDEASPHPSPLPKGERECAASPATRCEAREAMALAAYLSGMALANSGLGLAHGVAAALGVHCRVPHGLACAVMLPAAMRVNRPACEREMAELGEVMAGGTWPRLPETRALERLAHVSASCATPAAAADSAVAAVDCLCDGLKIPRRLSELGVRREQLSALVRDSRGNSMSGNPRQLTDDELFALLEGML